MIMRRVRMRDLLLRGERDSLRRRIRERGEVSRVGGLMLMEKGELSLMIKS